MHLKSLEIHGFKSFAQKTVFEFLPPKKGQNSITVIVGPNGSGKSNVSDAIRWVMGEQSLKQLRGKKSADVIFSGSASKSQMSMAQVMMTLDNTDGRASIEQEELVVGRRMYRSGESDYVVNGKVVRLLDLQLLLAQAQFGQGSYAVIGQGMIDRLLVQTAMERKEFFDEASGIKEFQIKRHQASLRMARTEENITQAELLLQEIAPHLKTLSKQVKKLEERQQVQMALRELHEQYYTTLWSFHHNEQSRLTADMNELTTSLEQAQTKLHVVQTELSELARGSSRHETFGLLQQQYQRALQKKNALERDRAVLQGKLHTEYTKSGHHQVGWLETKVSVLKDEQTTAHERIADAENAQAKDQQKLAVQEKQIENAAVIRTALGSELVALESQLLQYKGDQATLTVTGFHAVNAILEHASELGGVHGIVAQLATTAPEYVTALDVAAGGRLASVVVDTEETARVCVEYLRYQKLGVATFLPLTKIRPQAVPNFVFEMTKEKGVLGLAQDLVEYPDRFDDIFSFVFGSTLVVQDFGTAKRLGIGRVRMVTLEGDLFETSGAVKGGFRRETHHGLSFAGQGSSYRLAEESRDIEQTMLKKRNELACAQEELEVIKESARAIKSSLSVSQEKIDLLLEQKKRVDSELAGLERELAMETLSPEELSVVMKDMASQKDAFDLDIVKEEKELLDIEHKIGEFNREEEEKKQRVFALQDAMQKQQAVVSQLIDERGDKQISLAKVETKLEDLHQELYQEMHASIESVLARGVALVPHESLEGIQVKIQKLKYQLSLIGGIDEEVIGEYKDIKIRHDELFHQLEDLKKAYTDLETLTEELDTVMKKKRNKAFSEIRKEFSRYFKILFEGGQADLVELYGEEDDQSEAEDKGVSHADEQGDELSDEEPQKKKHGKKILQGIDITACPPGKKIKDIRALSGGERTLTSIALMCAILKTNPSPFVVLDEVEAALDESNTVRVVDILKELTHESQFIIITHNRVTMHAADALYGVSMGGDGVSQLLSVSLN